ncbi:TonB-dependent receptor (plasmid) [Pseudanabaena biceps]|nr:TonB-dependent receptor [Pseudanabaena biceps]
MYSFGVASAIVVILAPVVQAQTPITNIQVRQVGDSLELLLESERAIASEVNQRVEGNQLILEIPNAQLESNVTQSLLSAPIAGIQDISAAQQPNNVVKITLIGETTAPAINVQSGDSGLVFKIISNTFAGNTEDDEETELVITANRTEQKPSRVSRSVTVIEREEIERQTQSNQDLGSVLAKVVPGLSPSTETTSSFGQTLRGRNVSVLIDGVPQSTNRNAQRDLRTIDPSVIERIEVLRGPSAIYGDGATGGIINIITRKSAKEPFAAKTTIGTNFSPTNLQNSFGYRLQQSVSGTDDKLSYFADASLSTTGGRFDSAGDRIPPDPLGQGGLADLTTLNLFAKLGYQIDDTSNIQFSVNHFNDQQNSRFALNPTPSGTKAEARAGLELPNQPNTKNTILNLAYSNANIFGSKVNGQVYYRNYSSRFYPFDDDSKSSTFGGFVLQSQVQSDKIGGRLDINTPLAEDNRLNLLWGVDYAHESTSQPADLFDEAIFEASNGLVFRPNGRRNFSPTLNQNNLGLFAQLTWNANEQFSVNGGVRQEFIGVNIGDFTTLAGNQVGGGKLDYSATLFNVGAAYSISDNIDLFGSFAQGFSTTDVARVLRTAPAGFNVAALRPEAQRVDNYEIGVRGTWDTVKASLTAFTSYSNLGTTFDAQFNTLRDPQRIYGVEADFRVAVNEQLALGGTFTYSEGERDVNRDGDFESPLPNFQITPIKLTGFVEFQATPQWSNRFQLNYLGSRDPKGTGFGLDRVDSYLTADLMSSYDTGSGKIQLGIENLFNSQYFPVISQVSGGRTKYAGQGTTVTLSYSINW